MPSTADLLGALETLARVDGFAYTRHALSLGGGASSEAGAHAASIAALTTWLQQNGYTGAPATPVPTFAASGGTVVSALYGVQTSYVNGLGLGESLPALNGPVVVDVFTLNGQTLYTAGNVGVTIKNQVATFAFNALTAAIQTALQTAYQAVYPNAVVTVTPAATAFNTATTFTVSITGATDYTLPTITTQPTGGTVAVTNGAAGTLTVPSPAAATNATGWYAYLTQAGGATFTRQQAAGSPTAIGTGLTLTAPPTSSGLNPQTADTTCGIQYAATAKDALAHLTARLNWLNNPAGAVYLGDRA